MKKKILSALLCVAMVSTMLAGCAPKEEPKAPDTKTEDNKKADDFADTAKADSSTDKKRSEEYTIVVMPKLVGVPYFTEAQKGVDKAAKELGVNVIFNGPSVADAAEQVKMLEDYITQGVDAICVAPNDAAALDGVLKKAREAGIKILDWDTEATKDLVDLSIHQISDKELAEHLMQKMVENMGTEEGEYAIITGGLSASNLNLWIKYGTEYAEKNYPKLKLVADPFPTDEKQDVALSTAKDILKAYPDVKGLYCVSTPAPIGAAMAIRELKLQDKVTVVGTAVEADCQDVLSDGSLDLGVLWNCPDLGYLTVAAAKALLDGTDMKDGVEIEGWGKVKMEGDKNVILGPPADYVKK